MTDEEIDKLVDEDAERLLHMLALMAALVDSCDYRPTFAVRLYKRNNMNNVNINPTTKNGYRLALYLSKKTIANDNFA